MVTEMSLGQEDFQQLQAKEGVAITFCLKEFRVRFPPSPHHPVLPAQSKASLLCSLPTGAPELCRVSKFIS